MRLWKKKFYREVVCKSCDGTGKKVPIDFWGYDRDYTINKMCQGICIACNGKGTQTVLEREE